MRKEAHVLALTPIVYQRTTFESIDFGWSFQLLFIGRLVFQYQ